MKRLSVVADVELAMSIVQLTGVLIPLLLGLTRYYVNNDSRINVSDYTLRRYMAILFLPLLLAYFHAFTMVGTYGNPHLTNAVSAYGAFLVFLFAGIPYILNQKKWAYLFVILGAGVAILTLFMTGLIFLGVAGAIVVGLFLILVACGSYVANMGSDDGDDSDDNSDGDKNEPDTTDTHDADGGADMNKDEGDVDAATTNNADKKEDDCPEQ